jgi:flavin reductase (DIM6/NTAB) family NADH-FMN oxidoreductase RutF
MTRAIDAASFRAAMARFPGAVTIVTALWHGERRGITATAVCSVSADPPSLLVCLNRKTGTCAAVDEAGMFNVNLLAGPESPLALRFAGAGGATGAGKFGDGAWREDGRGLPLLDTAIAALSCTVTERMAAASHMVFIGTVVESRLGDGHALVYEQQAFHRLERLTG